MFFTPKHRGRSCFYRAIRSRLGSNIWAALFLILLMVELSHSSSAQTQATTSAEGRPTPVLILGFMGGFVHADDLRHSEVQTAHRLEEIYGNRVEVHVFENRETAKARKWILDRLASAETVGAGGQQERRARIFLFGHSWGASAAIYLARQLERDQVPVSLTVQVDSIRKKGFDDSVIPANVAEAMNFYQTRGWLHGRPAITAADPSRTKILGNVRLRYEKAPRECSAYPWYDRLLFKGHTAIECDPRVWSQIESLIKLRLPELPQPTPNLLATGVTP